MTISLRKPASCRASLPLSSVADQPKAGQDDSGEGQGAAEGGGGDTRWMCVEPDISWQSVDFVGADEVSDSSTGSAADDASRYTVYRMMAHTVDGRSWEVAKRYSEFEVFRQELLAAGCSISHLSFPSKTTWSRQSRTDSKLVAQRMAQLQAWMFMDMNSARVAALAQGFSMRAPNMKLL